MMMSMGQTVAQSKIDPASRLLLMRELQQKETARDLHRMPGRDLNVSERKLVLIDTQGDEAKRELAEAGAEVLRMRGSIALCSVATDRIEEVAQLTCVRRVEFGHLRRPQMDCARQKSGIDYIHQGIELPQAYTGKGVVTGIVDSGFDPNHVNFLTSDGKTRFGYMSRICETSSNADGYTYEDYYPQDELPIINEYGEVEPCLPIEEFQTDTKVNYHGTHTLGAMAGGYRGEVTTAVLDELGMPAVGTTENPFYGGATESEIVASCGDLYDEFIVFGLEDIITYAQFSNGIDAEGYPVAPKPCVINLSLGGTLGSHSPNSLMNRYLELLGEEAIVCVAAGNDGNLPITMKKSFTAEETELKSFIVPQEDFAGAYTEDGINFFYNIRVGTLYVYSDSETPVDVQAVVFNSKRGTIAMRMAVGTEANETVKSWASSSDYDVFGNALTTNTTFNKAFNGYVAAVGTIDQETGRYMAIVDYFISDNQETNADSNYKLGLLVSGADGQRVQVFGDGTSSYFASLGIEGWSDGSTDGTISDMACANNVLTVGSYNTRNRWTSLDGKTYACTYGDLPDGEVSFFSSYGTMDDGSTLPHVCAPGACIISSVNTYCVENQAMLYDDDVLQAKCTAYGRNSYWHEELGTSMSTPVVAGGIALWLQADPTLTIDEVKDIIRTTSVADEQVQNGVAAKWGAGKFDAYAGLKEVIRRKAQGIETVEMQGALNGVAGIYTLSGKLVREVSSDEENRKLDTTGLASGVYVIRLKNGEARKIVYSE